MFHATDVMEGFQRLTKALAEWSSDVLCFRVGQSEPFRVVAADAAATPYQAERLSVETVLGSVLMVEGILDPEDLDGEYLKLVEGWGGAIHGAAMVQMEGRGRCFVLLPS